AQVIAKLLVKEPKARYQRAAEVLIDLNATLGEAEPVESEAIRESYLQAATFVGRAAEMGQLTAALGQAQAGAGAVWLIGGESGVGKSRLVDELRIQAMVKGIAVLHGQAVEGGGLPFQLWHEPVHHLLLRQEVTELQARILKDIVPDIGSLLGREITAAPKLEGHAYQQRLILAIVDLFRDLPEPVLLLLEDLQWAQENLAPLKQMLQAIEQLSGVMVLGNYRHDERPQLPEELPGAQALILERLDEAEVAQLSQAMLGEEASTPHIVSLLTQETEGNTFFIVEVMRALAEEAGQLDNIGTMALPEEVFTSGMQHLLQRRIQKVPAADQHLLQLAAVAGRQLDEQLLHTLASGVVLADWLQRTAEAMVLMVRDNQWQFSHDKLRETILFQLSGEARRSAHRHVAEAIEQLYPEDTRNYSRLLEHWQAVGDEKKELTYLVPVAIRLVQMSDFGQARALVSRGLVLLPPVDGRRVVLLNEQARSYWRQGNFAEAEAAALLALTLAQEAGDDVGQATSLNYLGIIASKYGKYNTAHDYYQQSLAINQAIDSQQGIAANFLNMGVIMKLQGSYAAARDYYQQSLITHRAVGDQEGIFVSLNNLGIVAEREGEYAAARDYQHQSLAIKRALGDQRAISNGFLNLGVIAESEGEYAVARDYYQQSLAIKQAIGSQRGIAISFLRLGFIARHQGEYTAARDYHQQVLAITRNFQAAPLLLEA
ncbi:MAG: tetratricopeptide repeat protein, partial [Gammaproteobacteria bacterium]|nr:tetratricopeptide repeat protein [Gammaproteobacteria bacterium]